MAMFPNTARHASGRAFSWFVASQMPTAARHDSKMGSCRSLQGGSRCGCPGRQTREVDRLGVDSD